MLTVAEEILGAEEFSRILMSMPIEERHMLQYTIVNTGWYPTSLYRYLLKVLHEESSEGGDELIRKIGAASIRRDVNGVYRMIFKVFSPETVFSVAGRMFTSYYSHGRLEIASGAGEATATYKGCFGFDRLMWIELAGCGEELILAAGGKNQGWTSSVEATVRIARCASGGNRRAQEPAARTGPSSLGPQTQPPSVQPPSITRTCPVR